MKYLIGIDVGTSGTKSVLFDISGKEIASVTEEYPLYQPKNGWAEQKPEDWWNAVCKTLKHLTPYAKDGETRLRVTAKAKTQEVGLAMCDSLIEKVMATEVGQFVFGIDVETIENAVLMALRADGETLATAESCTGGLISKRLTDISGASDVYLGGAVTYANEAKVKILGVSEDDLKAHGAVSEPVARQLAEGVRALLGADYGISVTGIAGPTGGSEEKPVGTVFVGVASKNRTIVKKLSLSHMRDREYVRTVAATGALAMILEEKKVK